MLEKDKKLAEEAKQYVKKNHKRIVRKFADPTVYPGNEYPVSFFMAGSPGAGKTEVSKRLVEVFEIPTVRIDADDVKKEIKQYNGTNSAIVHGAASLGVEKIVDFCFANNQSFILDGLLADFDKAVQNIDRCLSKGRLVYIFYIYQEPEIAWKFTQEREKVEGRNIPKSAFIHGFIESRHVVQRLKDTYKSKIVLNVIEKNYKNENKEIWTDVSNIDKYIPNRYSVQELEDML
jgi:predicted ABC-type ATPase